MTAEITYIDGALPVADALEALAERFRDGEYGVMPEATVVIATDPPTGQDQAFKILHLGMVDERTRGANAVFNLNYAIHRMMRAAHGDSDA